MNVLTENLQLLLPLIVLELSLTIVALIHVLRHPKYRFGNRILWILMCFVQIIGPIIYFVFGKGEDE